MKIASEDIIELKAQRKELVVIANDLADLAERLRAWTLRQLAQLDDAALKAIARERPTDRELEDPPSDPTPTPSEDGANGTA